MNIKGKYILVTGSARRIGAAIARNLAECGANVIVHYNHSSKDAESLSASFRALGLDSFAVQADFADTASVGKAMDTVLAKTGGILDALVNSASIYATTGSIEAETCRAVHVLSPLALVERFASIKHRCIASIVNITDTRVASTDAAHAEYLEAKRELAALTRALAVKFAPKIRVNAIAPGAVLQEDGKPESDLARLEQFNPLHSHGSPSGLASCVRFLLENDFITGETIHYDGGYHLK